LILEKSHNESKVDKVSGSLICDVCEQTFDTMESFKEHKASEKKDEGLKYIGIDYKYLLLSEAKVDSYQV
jgi:hypothetical protein